MEFRNFWRSSVYGKNLKKPQENQRSKRSGTGLNHNPVHIGARLQIALREDLARGYPYLEPHPTYFKAN